jgi:hypothetical protein
MVARHWALEKLPGRPVLLVSVNIHFFNMGVFLAACCEAKSQYVQFGCIEPEF